MSWSQEIQSNASESGATLCDFCSIQGEHNQVVRAPEYENQQGIECIHSRMRSIELLESLQSPAYENQGIEHIRSSIRSTVFLETLQSSAYENQGIEYIQTSTIRSPAILQTLKPLEYHEKQGIEFIHLTVRSTVFSETPQAPECENMSVMGHIQAKKIASLSFKALQALEYENQQGSEYIHEKQRSMKQAQDDTGKEDGEELLSFYCDVLEAVEYGNYFIEDLLCEERPKLYDFVKQYGFDNIEALLKNDTYKIKNRPDTAIEMEKKALVLRICDAIERSRMSIQCEYAKHLDLNEHVQARIRSEVVHAAPEFEDREGIESIQVRIRSTTLSEALLTPDQYKKQNRDKHVQASIIRSTSFATKAPPQYVKLQKIHNIRTKEYQPSIPSTMRVNRGSSISMTND